MTDKSHTVRKEINMIRSLYAGVMGMKAHQAKMDVIGNNIANVSTYGFKSSRATFSDVYYQTLNGASASSNNRGGTNPTQIGYGASLNSVDVLHGQTGVQMTDRGMDVAISGDGFFQVQDPDGNVFYTRAGILMADEGGNIVDSNGNFVLGVSGNPLGKEPTKDKIKISIPSVDPTPAKVTKKINGINFTISTTNSTESGNIKFNFTAVDNLPLGKPCEAEITSGGITIKVNKNSKFNTLQQLQTLTNNAIKEANGGQEHPAGQFIINMDDTTKFPLNGLSGKDIANSDFAPNLGNIKDWPDNGFYYNNGGANGGTPTMLGFNYVGVSSDFTSSGDVTVNSLKRMSSGVNKDCWIVSVDIGGENYTGSIPPTATEPGEVMLESKNGGSFTITHPGYTAIEKADENDGGSKDGNIDLVDNSGNNVAANTITATPTVPSKALGLGSADFLLNGGTVGGPQDLSNITNIAIGANGVIEGHHPVLGRMELGRIDLVTFENPQGLAQMGNTYFSATANSGEAKYCEPGSNGSGALQAGSLELSNVDLSKEFADMITTQRGFQANSRLITVSDQILEELVNLKR